MTSPTDPPRPPQDPTAKLLDGGWSVTPGEPANTDVSDVANAGPTERARALREKADEIRKAAGRMIDEDARRGMTGVADQYDRLAGSVDRRRDRLAAADDD